MRHRDAKWHRVLVEMLNFDIYLGRAAVGEIFVNMGGGFFRAELWY
jgi:hypothetical protein